ncbi:hypothetical protein MAPG_01763 [Magnaporthiopsis poae ATCC 64411]|uniref:Uncharacterized protein n=1 Tax=Magnaporthiopsis poae (strain ATCC 64411 / 73-15) TaxID=644358 RepID=A0A0C4DPJ5_MAGP6|nr:hypothetical protein MAPG_01763 [Magnaporthiopsis poae ATCC 64411]
MNGTLPKPDYGANPNWDWPWDKFELEPDALFTTLHERFNTRTCPIQEFRGFLLDVRQCARDSDDQAEFYANLDRRRDERVAELERAWLNVRCLMKTYYRKRLGQCQEPCCLDRLAAGKKEASKANGQTANDTPTDHYDWFRVMSGSMAFDAMVRYFDGFVRDLRQQQEEERKKEEERYRKEDEIFRQTLARAQAELDKRRKDTASKGAGGSATGEPTPLAKTAAANPTSPSPSPSVLPDGGPATAEKPPTQQSPISVSPLDTDDAASERSTQTLATTPSPPRGETEKDGLEKTQTQVFDEGISLNATTKTCPQGPSRKRRRTSDGGEAEDEEGREQVEQVGTGDRLHRQPQSCNKRRRVSSPSSLLGGDLAAASHGAHPPAPGMSPVEPQEAPTATATTARGLQNGTLDDGELVDDPSRPAYTTTTSEAAEAEAAVGKEPLEPPLPDDMEHEWWDMPDGEERVSYTQDPRMDDDPGWDFWYG